MKNPTPRSLALFAASVAAVLVLLVIHIFYRWFPFTSDWVNDLLAFIITFGLSYLIIIYLLEVLVYRKVKLIYKSIMIEKKSREKTIEKMDLDSDIISNVNREVDEWKKQRSDEIAELKKLEIFRKEFLGNVSHELKTPLFSIQGYIHTLIDGGIDDKEVNIHYLQRAAKSVERLSTIIEDLESISKLESGEMILESRTFDIRDLVQDTFESLELRAREKNISLRLKEGSNRPFYVHADKERIRQVLVNLFVNSINYGKENGSTVVGFYDMDENILIEITDNGIGIEPRHLLRLFERFYRVDKSRSREQGGTGLGLSIVKHILEAHNQTINVRSTFGVGTTFAFTLKKT